MEGSMVLPGFCLSVALVFFSYLWDGASYPSFNSNKKTSYEIYGKHLYKCTGSSSLTMIHKSFTGTPPSSSDGLVLGPAPAGGHVKNLQIIVKYPNLLAMLVLSLPQIAPDSYIRWRDLAQVEFEQKIKLSISQCSLFQF